MQVYDKKYILFVSVFACLMHEVINANESNFCVNECDYTNNLTMMNASPKKFAKRTIDVGDLGMPFLSNILEKFSSENISNQCKYSLIMYFNDLMSSKTWAVEMFDATGKPPSSLLLGTVSDFGSYEDCLRIRVHSDDESFLFKGQFCMIHLQHPLFQPSIFKTENGNDYVDAFGDPPDWVRDFVNRDLSKRFGSYLGICTPSVCTEEDLYRITNAFAEPTALNVTLTDCAVDKENEHRQLPLSAKFAIAILSSILILCLIGTLLDLVDRKQLEIEGQTDENINRELLKSFSVYRNVETVFTVDAKKTPIDCAHGLRVAFCLWVLMGHYVVFPTFWKELRYRNLNSAHDFMKPEMIMVVINNALIVVEGFVYISGFFLTYTLWRKIEQTGGNIDIWENILMRYWRLTPSHIFVIIISFALPFISSGPVWNSTWEHENEKCLRNGWKNLLYLHNYDHIMDICWLHTWYIGVTMQCIAIFIPLMVFIYKYPKFGIFVSLLIMFGSMIHDYNTSIEQGFVFCSYNSFKIVQRVLDFTSTIYLRAIFHLPPNLIGMLSGWIVLKHKNRKLSNAWLVAGWTFCALCFTISLYAVYLPTTDQRIGALYIATRNTIFSLGLSWIMYVCAAGYGGVMNDILSWKALVPISRLSYCLYLVHPLFLALRDGILSERFYMDKVAHVVEIIPYVLITHIFGFLVYVVVQEPCNRVYDLLKKRSTTSKQKPSPSLPRSTCENNEKNGTKTL